MAEKNVEEDTNRTEATMDNPVMASRDEQEEQAQQDELELEAQLDDEEEVEITETAEIEDDDDEEPQDFDDMDDPRLKIAAKHDETHRNFGEKDESDEEIDDEDVETDESADIIELQPDQEEMIEVIVYGDTRMVPKSKVDKAGGLQQYQKQLAVEAGFQANAQRAESLDNREQALADREREIEAKEAALPTLDAQQGQTNPTDLPTGDQTIEQLAQRYQEAVYDGDESAPQLLAQLINRAAATQNTSIDVESIKQEAADEFERRERQKKVITASRTLLKEHPELDRKSSDFDPRLYQAVDDETVVVERQNPEWEPQEIIQEAYRRVAEWKGGQPTDTMADKAAAKRRINRPRAQGTRSKKPPPPPARTASDYVQDVKRARGQI